MQQNRETLGGPCGERVKHRKRMMVASTLVLWASLWPTISAGQYARRLLVRAGAAFSGGASGSFDVELSLSDELSGLVVARGVDEGLECLGVAHQSPCTGAWSYETSREESRCEQDP